MGWRGTSHARVFEPARGALFERGEQARAVAGTSLPLQRFAVQVVLPAHEATASSYMPVVGLYTSQFFR